MGRCVYTGIYEPGHPTADDDGFRGDVAGLVRELGVPIVRYPGGNFVSGYRLGGRHRAARPTAAPAGPGLAVDRDQPGRRRRVHCAGAGRVGSEPMMAVNLGTRGVDEARDLVEYCNHPSGTHWSDLRRAQRCRRSRTTSSCGASATRWTGRGRSATRRPTSTRGWPPRRPRRCAGSTRRSSWSPAAARTSRMPTFGTWEATVLDEAYDVVDYLSLHSYYEQRGDDRDSFLASGGRPRPVHRRGDRHVRPRPGESAGTASGSTCRSTSGTSGTRAGSAARSSLDWAEAPRLIEDTYSVVDAVVVGSLLITLLRHADRVRIACLAQLVNVIAPIRSPSRTGRPGGSRSSTRSR